MIYRNLIVTPGLHIFFKNLIIYQDHPFAFLAVRQLKFQLVYGYHIGKALVTVFMLNYKLELEGHRVRYMVFENVQKKEKREYHCFQR